eukprot:15436869-Alexandrium_andersonii.AAC.1
MSPGEWSSSSGASCHTELAGCAAPNSPGSMARGGPCDGREWSRPSGERSWNQFVSHANCRRRPVTAPRGRL